MKLLVYLLLLTSFVAINNDKEKVAWKENKKLSWAMFKAVPPTTQDFVASTNSGISMSYSVSNRSGKTQVEYTINSYFYPNQSWYRPGNVNAQILAHEQTHFDISELFARKLRQKFSGIASDSDFKISVEKIYKQNEKERVAMQHLFDKETDHSRIDTQEVKWEIFVQEQLQQYNDWKR